MNKVKIKLLICHARHVTYLSSLALVLNESQIEQSTSRKSEYNDNQQKSLLLYCIPITSIKLLLIIS